MIGISSPTFSLSPFLEMLELLSAEFRLWEIVAEGRHSIQDIEKDFKDAASTCDMRFQIHAPLSDINIASVDQQVREISIRRIANALKFANHNDIGLVTIHPGHLSPLGVLCPDDVSKTNRASLRAINEMANEWGVKVAVENMPKAWNTFCLNMGELMDAIGGTELQVCFDIGHANTSGTMDSFLKEHERVINIHAHDNTGKFDEHLVIGEGTIDFSSIFNSMPGYGGNVIIESRGFESGVESLRRLREILE